MRKQEGMTQFTDRIVICGFGVVAQAVLPLLLERLQVALDRITVIDLADRSAALHPWMGPGGVRFVRERVTPANLSQLLAGSVGPGGLIIDLAWSIDFFDIVQWAHDHGVLYVNASLESWEQAPGSPRKSLAERGLYPRWVRALDLASRWTGSPTAVVDHGSNPGLVSSFAKKALLDIGDALLRRGFLDAGRRRRVEALIESHDFPRLARELGVRALHCSEQDSQRPLSPKAPLEFVGTWSIEAMWDESLLPSEFGWGTHEKTWPPLAVRPPDGPRNVLILPQMGMNTWVRSWVPHREIVGMAMTHAECIALSHALTVREKERVVYRPTVLYAYMPCGESLLSLHELRCRNYRLHSARRIMTREIRDGSDTMGVLVMGHPLQAWWTGTVLSIEQARRIVPGANATAVQVAAGVVAAAMWAIRNPRKGLCFPEDLPHEEILRMAGPYLGEIVSEATDWTPLTNNGAFLGGRQAAADPWQFGNFLFQPWIADLAAAPHEPAPVRHIAAAASGSLAPKPDPLHAAPGGSCSIGP
jgi:homospermidine synthase